MSKLIVVCLTVFLFTIPYTAKAVTLDVTIDTSNWAGTSASLAFDLIDGDNTVNNTVQISNFLINGSGSFDSSLASFTGGASGALDSLASLAESGFFNELLQPIVLGSSLQFQLQLTDSFAASTFAVPDRFSFFILDEPGFFSLFPTTDPTGADSLFGIDLNGQGGELSLYAADSASWRVESPRGTVLEPSSLALLLIGFWGFKLRAWRKARPS